MKKYPIVVDCRFWIWDKSIKGNEHLQKLKALGGFIDEDDDKSSREWIVKDKKGIRKYFQGRFLMDGRDLQQLLELLLHPSIHELDLKYFDIQKKEEKIIALPTGEENESDEFEEDL